jgi:hypothetical protein
MLSISHGACEALADRVALLCGLIKGLSVHVWGKGASFLRAASSHATTIKERALRCQESVRMHATRFVQSCISLLWQAHFRWQRTAEPRQSCSCNAFLAVASSCPPGGGFAITRSRQPHRRSHVRDRDRNLHRWSHTVSPTEKRDRRVDDESLPRAGACASGADEVRARLDSVPGFVTSSRDHPGLLLALHVILIHGVRESKGDLACLCCHNFHFAILNHLSFSPSSDKDGSSTPRIHVRDELARSRNFIRVRARLPMLSGS